MSKEDFKGSFDESWAKVLKDREEIEDEELFAYCSKYKSIAKRIKSIEKNVLNGLYLGLKYIVVKGLMVLKYVFCTKYLYIFIIVYLILREILGIDILKLLSIWTKK